MLHEPQALVGDSHILVQRLCLQQARILNMRWLNSNCCNMFPVTAVAANSTKPSVRASSSYELHDKACDQSHCHRCKFNTQIKDRHSCTICVWDDHTGYRQPRFGALYYT